MTKVLTLILVGAVALMGCATVRGSGKVAEPVSEGSATSPQSGSSSKGATAKGLIVSGSENTNLASQYFTLVDLTFENDTPEWIRIKKVAIDLGSPQANSDIRFPVGQDLIDWADSAQQVAAIREYNIKVALGAAAGIGAGVAISSGSNQNAGAALAAGSGMSLAANNIGTTLDGLQRAKVIPQDHLLSGAFAVPPGLHKKRWITLYAPRPMEIPFVSAMALTLTYDDGKSETVKLKLRDDVLSNRSTFQKQHPTVSKARNEASKKARGF